MPVTSIVKREGIASEDLKTEILLGKGVEAEMLKFYSENFLIDKDGVVKPFFGDDDIIGVYKTGEPVEMRVDIDRLNKE